MSSKHGNSTKTGLVLSTKCTPDTGNVDIKQTNKHTQKLFLDISLPLTQSEFKSGGKHRVCPTGVCYELI